MTVEAPTPAPHGEPSPWRDRRFLVFAAGNTVNNIGEGIYAVALPLLAYDLTGSLVVMSLLAAITPASLLIGPFLGVVVDRFGPRAVVVPGLVLQIVAAVALNLLALGEGAPLWPLFVFGALVQLGGAAYRAGWMAGVAVMFPDRPVRSRGSLGSLYVATLLLGPIVVALALPGAGYAGLLWTNAVTFVAPIAVWLVGIHPPHVARRAPRPVRRDLAEGATVLRARPGVLAATLVGLPMLLVGTTGTLTLVVFQLQDAWRLSPETVSGVLVAVRVGSLVGTLAVSERRSLALRPLLAVTTVGMVSCLLLMAVPVFEVFLISTIAFFTLQAALAVSADMMIVKFLPADALGRVSGLLGLVEGVPVLLAPLLIPLVVGGLGARSTFLVLAVIAATAPVLWWRLRHSWDEVVR